MIKGIYTAARSLDHKMKNIDVIANNLANLNTTGFKREIPFSEIINSMGDSQIVKLTNQEQGDIVQTSNPLDLAISGKGFFAVRNADGVTELTRNGKFNISDEGFLVDAVGNKVLGTEGFIQLEETMSSKNSSIVISKNGEIKVDDKLVGNILVLNVNDSSNLTRSGNSTFELNGQEAFAAQEGDYALSQGYLEQANTNPIVEMEAMIQLNKEYESAQKIIAGLDQSLGHANEIAKV